MVNNILKLIKKQFNDSISTEEEYKLREWYDNSPNNQQIYAYYYSVLKLFRIKQNEQLFIPHVTTAYKRIYRINNKRSIRGKEWWLYSTIAYAASVLFAFGIGYLTNHNQDNQWSNSMQSIEIAYGSKSTVVLPDGTQVWLNSGSKLEYPGNFGQTNRNVTLKGEAYFEVSKNKELPFRVTSGKVAIHVLGTKFNMKAYPEDEKTKITLIEGSLKVEDNKNPNTNIILKPNQQAVINQNSKQIQVRNVIASNYTLWTTSNTRSAELSQTNNEGHSISARLPKAAARNILFFDEEPLYQIAKDLERAFNVHIEIEDMSLQGKHFYGDFCNEETITDILKIIAEKHSLCYTIKDDTIQILKKSKIRNRVN